MRLETSSSCCRLKQKRHRPRFDWYMCQKQGGTGGWSINMFVRTPHPEPPRTRTPEKRKAGSRPAAEVYAKRRGCGIVALLAMVYSIMVNHNDSIVNH